MALRSCRKIPSSSCDFATFRLVGAFTLHMKFAALVLAVCPVFALDPGLLAYVGGDATEVAGVYVDRTAGSPIGQFLQTRVARDLDRFGRATGFDPRRDLREVLFVPGKSGTQGLAIARGVFEPRKLGRARGTVNGVELYQARYVKAWLAFPEPTIALFGDEATVREALARRGQTEAIDARLAEKVNAASGKYDVWFAAKGRPGMALGFGNTAGPKIDTIDMVSGGATLGATVNVTAEAEMRSESDAQSLVGLLKFVSGMVQAQAKNPNAAPALGLLNNAEARADGSVVVVTTWAREADLEQLVAGLMTQGKRAPQRRRQ
jgi:hypothetical protein